MKITTGIASTTHVDRHNERITKSALDGAAEQIRDRFIPLLIEHDQSQHIGVVLYGEVFQLKDGEYALGYVSGTFESSEEAERYKTGQPNDVWQDYRECLDVDELSRMNEQHSQVNSPSGNPDIADSLETHLDSTQVLPDGTVYRIKRFIAATGDLRIVVYPKDHDPQHFHVTSRQRGIDARFDIQTLNLISMKQGKMKGEDVRKIQDFFKTHPKCLEQLIREHAKLQ